MKKVLIVDDQADILELLNEVLNDEFEVETSGSGEEVIGLVNSFKPDILLMDVNLGGIDGIEILKRIKNILSHCYVIMLSGNRDSITMNKAMSYGANGYIIKPFDIFALKAMIKELSSKKLAN